MPLLAIALAALTVRLAWGLAVQPPPTAVMSDAMWYHDAAVTLARGDGYLHPLTAQPTALWPPGYPLLLASVYAVGGADPRWALILNAIAGTITVVACWALTLRLTGSARHAAASATAVAFLPSQVFFAALVLTETVFTAALTVLALAAGILLETSGGGAAARWLLWGAAIGLAALVRSEAVLLAGVPGLVALATTRERRVHRALRISAAVLVGGMLVLSPWVYRNWRTFGSFVLTSTNVGRTLWIGHNEHATGGMTIELGDEMSRTIEPEYGSAPSPAAEIRVNRRYLRDAIAWATSHPRRELELVPRRIYHLWRGDHVWSSWYQYGSVDVLGPRLRTWLERASNAYFAVVLVAALAAVAIGVPAPRPALRVLHVIVACWIGFFALVYGDPRFHVPLLPLLIVIAIVQLRGATSRARPA